jgi:predicted small lipoprotein YifL
MFRYLTATLTACALGGVITVFAQEQNPPSQTQKEQEKPAQQAAATLTGCVQEAKTTDGGKVFVLNKAQGGNANMYVLLGPNDSEIASHVNHKLEVTGQVQEPAAPAEGEAPKDPKVLRPPMVQVESVKLISETCE